MDTAKHGFESAVTNAEPEVTVFEAPDGGVADGRVKTLPRLAVNSDRIDRRGRQPRNEAARPPLSFFPNHRPR